MKTDLPPKEVLSKREREVLRLIALEHTSQQIANELFVSIHTVNFHRKNIRSKLSVDSVGEMILYAYQHQLI